MKLRDSPLDGTVPLDDLLRRLESRGFEIEPWEEDGTVLHFGPLSQVIFFTDPVEEAVVWYIAEFFGIDVKMLYFDKTERDLN